MTQCTARFPTLDFLYRFANSAHDEVSTARQPSLASPITHAPSPPQAGRQRARGGELLEDMYDSDYWQAKVCPWECGCDDVCGCVLGERALCLSDSVERE
jgi:hypothetical protein